MSRHSRRAFLASLGTVTAGSIAGTATGTVARLAHEGEPEGDGNGGGDGEGDGHQHQTVDGVINKIGHSLLSDPPGAFAAEDIRADGAYGVIGSYLGEGGSFLVDLEDPAAPSEAHRVPSADDIVNGDVKFDARDGLYYRSEEWSEPDAEFSGTQIIDYGYETGSPEEPEIVGEVESGDTHTLTVHPSEPLIYPVNVYDDGPGFEVWDVSDPTAPSKLGDAGPDGSCHDVVFDPGRDLIHAAYIGDPPGLDGYVILDASDPTNPTEIGRFDYAGERSYSDTGDVGFENCHYADYDPNRGIAVIGDETAFGVPGGKHIFDIGWAEGSPSDPQHLGFTRSPNARLMNPDPDDDGEVDYTEIFDWTTHNHDVVPAGESTLLVSGDYSEGVVLYDITDPREPTPIDQYRTVDEEPEAQDPLIDFGGAPAAWGAKYNPERDLVFASDMVTGAYTFEVRANLPIRT